MGSAHDNWAAFEGAIYMGANSSWEAIWCAVAVGICVFACIIGSMHETAAYQRAGNGGK